MLSLAGFPITAGFPGRWGLLSVVASLDHYAWIALVGSMGILGVAAIRSAMALFLYEDTAHSMILDWKRKIFLGGGMVLTIFLGIFPQLLFPWIIKALEGITFPLI
jgi:NADH:ubiquinone oxidoreductase subunit 2 (subunit N)